MNEWYTQGIFSFPTIQLMKALFISTLYFLYDYPEEKGSVNLQAHSQQNIVCERGSNVVEFDAGKRHFFQQGCAANR